MSDELDEFVEDLQNQVLIDGAKREWKFCLSSNML